ncbi:hypothetical protein [Acidianus brierleyi]|uniref:Uncharacterized protein n=1 Tax=Acidianus brierleyi TaxID=41673 RepID=A0A2U9IDD9_9CREN|nr:hypothetical protein [Acidianus brierleyi]AWR94053.1 hypothetical protein DFR85_04995 [Acidianus brierleyi]
MKIDIDETELDIKDGQTLHVRVRNDKRCHIIDTNTAYECYGRMWIFWRDSNKNEINYYCREKDRVDVCKLEEKKSPLGPYTLKWSNLPSSKYKRFETIINIPCGVKENCKLGRQLDLFGVKVINNEPYIIIQDTQQQASRDDIWKDISSKYKQQLPPNISNLPPYEAVDICLFKVNECQEDIKKEILQGGNILRILFNFPSQRIYYMAVKVICANAKSKIEVFKIAINNNKIRIEKCNDRNILKKIKIVVKRHNEPRNPCTITSNSKNKS